MAQKILLVDDDNDFIEINKTILEASGYIIATAHSTTEALEKLRDGEYDVAIIDLIMEELDSGFTLVYAIRDSDKMKDMPILMLTSAQEKTGFMFDLTQDQEWMKVDDFAAKPLKPAELVERIQKLINASKEL